MVFLETKNGKFVNVELIECIEENEGQTIIKTRGNNVTDYIIENSANEVLAKINEQVSLIIIKNETQV